MFPLTRRGGPPKTAPIRSQAGAKLERWLGGALRTVGTIAVSGAALVALATAAAAESAGFDLDHTGSLPGGWTCGSTDGGAPLWRVDTDDSAPSPPNVLKQIGSGSFPWCVKQGARLADGVVEVKFSPLAGDEVRAGGLVWRWKDGDTYYVARADARVPRGGGNVSLYAIENGRPHLLREVDAPVAANAWHALRIAFKGSHIQVFLDDKSCIEVDDSRIAGEGGVGVWTKADSVTAFDDFNWTSVP